MNVQCIESVNFGLKMKAFLCLLLIKVCCCLGDSEQSSDYSKEIVYDDEDYGHQLHGQFVRPCSLHDVNCIRRYFARNSQCYPVHGPTPDPQRIKTLAMDIPHVNITFVLNDAELKGFNDFKIKEFYINKETDKLVLEVEFRKIWVYSPYTVITFHRKGREPLEVADYAAIEYRDLSFTLTVSDIKELKLSRAHVYTYISDAAPKNALGPNFTESKEPLVREVIRRLVQNIGLSLQEAFVSQGPIFLSVFLETSICKF